jgi:hypothetical protein
LSRLGRLDKRSPAQGYQPVPELRAIGALRAENPAGDAKRSSLISFIEKRMPTWPLRELIFNGSDHI